MAVLRFLHVGKKFGGAWPLHDASLEVNPGELVWLGGPPGSGKSLVVRIAAALAAPTAGSLEVNGVNPAKLDAAGRLRLRRALGIVADDEPPLDLPAEAWVALGLWCAGRAWAPSRKAAAEALARCGEPGLASRPYRSLSRGQRFRLALARALARGPNLLLVDWSGGFEPALPGPLRDELARYLAGGGAALVTGDPEPGAADLGGRVVRLGGPGAPA